MAEGTVAAGGKPRLKKSDLGAECLAVSLGRGQDDTDTSAPKERAERRLEPRASPLCPGSRTSLTPLGKKGLTLSSWTRKRTRAMPSGCRPQTDP